MTNAQIDKVLNGDRRYGDAVGKLILRDGDFIKIINRLKSEAAGYPGLDPEGLRLVRHKIFNAPNAPVSYPFLWDITRSDYVQWNGLASNAPAGPLDRNAGEVTGVFAILDWQEDKRLFTQLFGFSLPALLSSPCPICSKAKRIKRSKSTSNRLLTCSTCSGWKATWAACNRHHGRFVKSARTTTTFQSNPTSSGSMNGSAGPEP